MQERKNIKISLAPCVARRYRMKPINKITLPAGMIKPRRNLQLGKLAKLVGKEKILKEYEGSTARERWATKMAEKHDR